MMVRGILVYLALVYVTTAQHTQSRNRQGFGQPGLNPFNPFIQQQPWRPTTSFHQQGSNNCLHWCRTSQGQYDCCEGANEPLSAADPKQDIKTIEEHISIYNLELENEAEELKRLEIFEVNLKKVQDHNKLHDAGKTSYRMGLNQFSHLTYEEVISMVTGLNASGPARRKRSTGYYNPIDSGNEPSSLDWVERGVVNPIRNQVQCNSDWAFSTTCAIEGQIKLRQGVLQQLSEQYLIDCDSGNDGCKGGWPLQAISYVMHNGIASAAGYPYTGKYGTCDKAAPKTSYSVTSVQLIRPGSDADLLHANFHIGPISVVIYASKNFQSYASGVFDEPECTGEEEPNLAVVLVGYGTENGHNYWLVRNSWGEAFGERGYIKMTRDKTNFCSISSYGVFPVVTEG